MHRVDRRTQSLDSLPRPASQARLGSQRLSTSQPPRRAFPAEAIEIPDRATSSRLGRVRQRGTAPELAVRRLLHCLGFRFRVRNNDLPGSPDVANRSAGWALFVHGCFWHSHNGCGRATVPKRNRAFWEAKFDANRARDKRAVDALRRLGFRVLTVWECEVNSGADALARRLVRQLPRRLD